MFHPVAAILISVAFAGPADSSKESEGTVFCHHRAFRIPVDMTAAERATVSAVRVYVSTDDGRTWNRCADAPADAKSVTYRSIRDGNYCFAMALIQKDGTQIPADVKSMETGLKVVVDTAQPSLMIKPVRSTAGKRGIRWEVADDHLDAASMRVAYCSDDSNNWKPMTVRSPEKAILWFEDGVEVRKLQACVCDKAGNETVQEVEIVGDRFTKSMVASFALSKPATQTTSYAQPQTKAQPPMREMNSKTTTSTASVWTPPFVAQPAAPVTSAPTSSLAKALDMDKGPSKPPAMPEKAWSPQIQPAAHSQSAATSHTAYSPVRPAANKPREYVLCGAEPIVVNYEVERTPGAPTPKVELWGTRDRGVTWTKLASDPDGISPIEANLPQDGVWGLKIVTRAATAPEAGPKSGTQPDTYVESDRLPPSVMVGTAEIQRGQVAIRWEANDKNMPANAISIYYGRTPQGPWSEVAKAVENTGEYVWNFSQAGVAGNVYFRVEAVDEAKNTAVSMSPMVVSLDPQSAKARVLQVQSRSADQR